MSKTPEELIEEYAPTFEEIMAKYTKQWDGCPYILGSTKGITAVSLAYCDGYEIAFLAGYKAAQEEAEARIQELQDQLADTSKVMNSPENPDSCEHILDMEKMVDANSLNNSNGWISVKDRLPNVEKTSRSLRRESSCVLIVSYDNVYVAHLCEDWSDREHFIFEACNCNCRAFDMEIDEWKLDQVTHWQPLPAPPKEEE